MVSDMVLMDTYTKKLDRIVKIHRDNKSSLEWLKKNNLESYQEINKAEDKLNTVWSDCLTGDATIQDFERVLSAWYGVNINGCKLSAWRRS